MEEFIKTINDNFNAILSGFFVIIGTILGWALNQLTLKKQNKPKIAFLPESTPDIDLTEDELRTKTSPSEWSIRIFNVGQTPIILDNISILYHGNLLVDCYCVCTEGQPILPSDNILYTLMEQDASALQRNYSRYYKGPNGFLIFVMRILKSVPFVKNYVVDPIYKQGMCKVIAYDIRGKKIYGTIDLPLLYIRHCVSRDMFPST